MKKCKGKCGELKPISDFNKQKTSKDGLGSYCKSCNKKESLNYQRSLRGKLIRIYKDQVKSQKTRSKNSGQLYLVEYSLDEFVSWAIIHPDYIRLYNDWVESGFLKSMAPSFDRKDDYGHYSFENINAWVTWAENEDRGTLDQSNGNNLKCCKAVKGVNLETGEVVEFFSQQEAARKLGINNGNISACCLGINDVNSAGGYVWSYSDISGDKQNDRKTKSSTF